MHTVRARRQDASNLRGAEARDKALLLRFYRHSPRCNQCGARSAHHLTDTPARRSRTGGKVMSNTVSQQHPAVVLRSHYVHLRTLLVIAIVAIVALAAAVVAL